MLVQETLEERKETHGDFAVNAEFTQRLKFLCRNSQRVQLSPV